MKIRVKVKWDGEAWRVDLPTYRMVPGSFFPLLPDIVHPDGVFPDIDPGLPQLAALTCEVEVPVAYFDPVSGKVDRHRVCALYRGQPKWDHPDRDFDI